MSDFGIGSSGTEGIMPASRGELAALENAAHELVRDVPESILRCYAYRLGETVLRFEHITSTDPGCEGGDYTALKLIDDEGYNLLGYQFAQGGHLMFIDVRPMDEISDLYALLHEFKNFADLNAREDELLEVSELFLSVYHESGEYGLAEFVSKQPYSGKQRIEDTIIYNVAAKAQGHLVMRDHGMPLDDGVSIEVSAQSLEGAVDPEEWDISPLSVVLLDRPKAEVLIYSRDSDGKPSMIREGEDQEPEIETVELLHAMEQLRTELGLDIPASGDVKRMTRYLIDAVVSQTSLTIGPI